MPDLTPEPRLLPAAPPFPKSPLPVLVYRGLDADPDALEGLFGRNGWTSAWRNGVFPYHHWHSTAHEVLGIAAGAARLRLGGPGGLLVEAEPGTVIVVPAGVAHCNEGSSPDFLVVGATASGRGWDINRGAPSGTELANLAALPLPKADPVGGRGGALPRLWRA